LKSVLKAKESVTPRIGPKVIFREKKLHWQLKINMYPYRLEILDLTELLLLWPVTVSYFLMSKPYLKRIMKRIYSVLLLISIASFSQEIALVNIVVVGIGMPIQHVSI
jgi:hypothetical protein